MEQFGKIVNGQLELSHVQLDGYKPVRYEEAPNFDQTTQYIVQGEIVDKGDFILVGVEVKELELIDDGFVEDENPVEESAPFIPKPTTEERLDILENTLLLLMME